MKRPQGLSFSMLMFFIASTHTTRIGQISSNFTSLGIIQDSKSIHCVPLPGRISLSACAGAILRLPIDHTVGIFHGGGAEDGFKLPVSRNYNECSVVVEIKGDGTDLDRGNWLDVGLAAAEMNGECARNTGSYRKYSRAWMDTGELDQVRIRLSPTWGWPKVVGNGTAADEKL